MNNAPSRFAAFIAELRRRRVFRVAVVYAGVAFIVIQIIDGAFDYLKIPEWVGSLIIIMLAVGFPIAVGMAWAFDLTAEGLVRAKPEREAHRGQSPATRRYRQQIPGCCRRAGHHSCGVVVVGPARS